MYRGLVLVVVLFVVVSAGCGVLTLENPQFPDLPGRITVILPGSPMGGPYTYAEYVNGVGFVPLTDQDEIPHPDRVEVPHGDPSTSPDGKWHLSDHPEKNRQMVSDGTKSYTFEYWTFSLSEVDWSPDSRYIVYCADEDYAQWTARIMVMDLQNEGKTVWIGRGSIPRWDAR